MKKILLLLTTGITLGGVNAQTVDTVSIGAGYANENYYTLNDGNEVSIDRSDWDLAFSASGLGFASSSVRINGATGTELYKFNNDISTWSTIDTTGFDWEKNQLLDSDTSWTVGSFENTALASGFDLGWGTYSVITHIVTGDRVFILKLADDTYKKLIIVRLQSGAYTFKYAGLDGSNEKTIVLSKSDYQGKNFGYYSIQDSTKLDREPLSSSWDLLFTKYIGMIKTRSGDFVPYGVTGVLANSNIKVAQANDVTDVDEMLASSQDFGFNISTIGSDWKNFSFATFSYVVEDSLVYFVETSNQDIYKIIFTGFGGNSNGDFVFTKQLVATVAGIEEGVSNSEILNVYPNPASEVINLTFTASNETTVSIHNVAGEEVLKEGLGVVESGLNQSQIDVSRLTQGVYFLTLTSANSKVTQKIVIQ